MCAASQLERQDRAADESGRTMPPLRVTHPRRCRLRNSALIAFVVAAAAACGGGDDDPIAIDGSVEDVDATVADPDASPSDPDAGPSASCDEFDSPAGTFSTYPAVITGDLDGAGADVEIEDPS